MHTVQNKYDHLRGRNNKETEKTTAVVNAFPVSYYKLHIIAVYAKYNISNAITAVHKKKSRNVP